MVLVRTMEGTIVGGMQEDTKKKLLLLLQLLFQVIKEKWVLIRTITSHPTSLGYCSKKFKWLVRSLKVSRVGLKRKPRQKKARNRWGPLKDEKYDRYSQTGLFSKEIQKVRLFYS